MEVDVQRLWVPSEAFLFYRGHFDPPVMSMVQLALVSILETPVSELRTWSESTVRVFQRVSSGSANTQPEFTGETMAEGLGASSRRDCSSSSNTQRRPSRIVPGTSRQTRFLH